MAMDLLAQEMGSCAACHQDRAKEFALSVHVPARVSCTDCHGGNAAATVKEQSHGNGFTGRPATKDVPQLCARCHADVRKMNPYGIPTDQHAQYLTSKHGEALAAGKNDVATCVSCHNAHAILKVRDPQSPVFPKNIPATCGKCHSDRNLMEKHGKSSNAETLYRMSVHADLLLNKSDLSAPTCVTCHGNHGATPPGHAVVSTVCGKCHAGQQQHFTESPHFAAAKDGIFDGCVQCHGNHLVLRAPEAIHARCETCHEAGDGPMTRRDAIAATIKATRANYEEVRETVDRATRAGVHTDDELILMEEAKTSLLQLPLVQHTLDAGKVRTLAASTDLLLAQVRQRLSEKHQAEEMKVIALIPIWIFLIVMAVLFFLKRREIEHREQTTTEQ